MRLWSGLARCNELHASAERPQATTPRPPEVVQIISADNLELGCSLIERAVVEKARVDIDEQMGPVYQRARSGSAAC